MYLGNFITKLSELIDQLRRLQLAVAAPRFENLGLILDAKVSIRKARAHNLLEKIKNLVVRDGTGVCKVVYAHLVVLRQKYGGGQEVMENRVAIGDVDYAVLGRNLGDETAWMKIIADGHAEA